MGKLTEEQKKTIWEFCKFTFFSCTAGIIQILSFTVLFEVLNIPYWVAYLTALVLSVLYNFTINRKFTFKEVTNIPVAMFKIFVYYCLFTPLSTWGGHFLTDDLNWNEYVVLAISMIANFVTEYLVYKIFVFSKDKKTVTEEENKDL
jgi:putative flippase GtrA